MRLRLPKKKTARGVKMPEGVKIVEEKPPVYKSVCQFLGYKDIHAFFTYGDTIYNPAKLSITGDLVIHEQVHMKQQKAEGMTPELWWGKWFRDEKFRIDQEAQGYGAQLRALKTIHKDREAQNRILHELSSILSSDLYGRAIDRSTAMLLIKDYSN